MSKHTAEPGMAQAYVELHRARIRDAVRRPLRPAGAGAAPLCSERAEFLRREAEELYWNELAWEQLTDEEVVCGGQHLTELVFPAFLAFVQGLLLESATADAAAPARPHPDVVEEILAFLGERYAAFTAQVEAGADSRRLVWARAMTGRLLDLVLHRLYRLTTREVEELDSLG